MTNIIQTITIFMVLALLVNQGQAVKGVDISAAGSVSNFQCMKSNGQSFAIMRGYRSYGVVDPNAAQTLKNIKAAGLIADIYHFPCTGQSATSQADAVVNALKGLYGTVWLDIESNPSSGCGWSSNVGNNCNFVQQLVQAYQAKGQKVGIYASQSQWQSIMGSATNCEKFTSLPVWYAHYDNNPSFSDWPSVKFGGWSQPAMKQYAGDTSMCSLGVDNDYYP